MMSLNLVTSLPLTGPKTTSKPTHADYIQHSKVVDVAYIGPLHHILGIVHIRVWEMH